MIFLKQSVGQSGIEQIPPPLQIFQHNTVYHRNPKTERPRHFQARGSKTSVVNKSKMVQ